MYQKFIDSLKNVINYIKGTPEEKQLIKLKKKLEKRFAEVYGETNFSENNDGETRYSTISTKGAKNLSNTFYEFKDLYANFNKAQNMYDELSDEGYSINYINSKVKAKYQWFKTKYGDWATLISDKGAKITQELKPNQKYKLGDIFEHPLLYKAYPGIEKMDVLITDTGDAYGALGHRTNKTQSDYAEVRNNYIKLNNKYINERNYIGTLIHEINHYIQNAEGFNENSRGTSISKVKNIDDYYNNLGEIMSSEANVNRDLTQKQLNDIVLPEQAKENPRRSEIKESILDREESDWNPTSPYSAKNIYENKEQELERLHRQFDGIRRITDTLYDEELDNSSFLNEQNVGAINNLNNIDGYEVQKDYYPYDEVIGHSFSVKTPVGEVHLQIRETNDEVYLNMINTRLGKNNPEKGAGTKILNNLKEYSDKTGKKLIIAGEVGSAEGFYNKFNWLNQEKGVIKDDYGNVFDNESLNRVYNPKMTNNETFRKYDEEINKLYDEQSDLEDELKYAWEDEIEEKFLK